MLILRGELEIILTAMRNRAAQLVDGEEEDEDDDEDYEDDEEEEEQKEGGGDEEEESEEEVDKSKLQFPNERRFPVRETLHHVVEAFKLQSTLLTLPLLSGFDDLDAGAFTCKNALRLHGRFGIAHSAVANLALV
jgi:hypothetical protein